MRWFYCACGVLTALLAATPAVQADRLKYLQEPLNPYYVHRELARLATPQWIGQPGVDAKGSMPVFFLFSRRSHRVSFIAVQNKP